MSHIRPSRTAVAAAVLLLTAAAGAASAAEPATTRILNDIAGDANAVNDQGEGLVGDIVAGPQLDQADLRNVVVTAPADKTRGGRTLRVSFTTTAAPAPMPDGTALAYGIAAQPGRNCRLAVEYITAARPRLGAPTQPRGLLLHSCRDGRTEQVPVAVSRSGRTVTVHVPEAALPFQARGARVLPSANGYVRTVPSGNSAARPGEIDNVR